VAEVLAAAADETPKPSKQAVTDDEDDDEDWAVDTSEAAVAARLKEQEEAYNKVRPSPSLQSSLVLGVDGTRRNRPSRR
jgi:hypothetical protein